MKVKFNPTTKEAELAVTPPKPAREYLPEWYKKIPAFFTPKPSINEKGEANVTVKQCMPFSDSLTSGYIQETWQDLYIEVVETSSGKELKYRVPGMPDMVSTRPIQNIPISDEYYPVEFTFHPAWVPQLPKGWSMLYSSPFNREDLPIRVVTGIVDNDTYTHSFAKSNLPFYIKKGFTGVIPKGTPMYQMIPIKREDWESEACLYDSDQASRINIRIFQHFWGGYKKLHWQKKSYK